MNRQQFNGRNINTINFNYRHLHRLGIRGGMEYVTFFQQDTDFGKDGNVLPIGSPDSFGPKNEKYGVLYVREGAEAQQPSATREHNSLVYIDNTGISHNLAGGTDMGYWTKKNPAPGPTGSHVINGDSGGAIRPVYGPRFAIKHAIMYNAEEKDSNPLYEDTSVWGGGAGGMQYIDSSNNTVYLKSPLIVMDKMQFLECQGESLASAGNLGTVRYTYGYGGQTGSTGCVSSGLDPSGSSFQGKILNEDGNPMWIKFGAGQTTHTQLWAERQAPGGTGCIVTTRNAPQGVGTALEIYPADCRGNYSLAIGKDCSAGYASVAAGTGNKALGDNSVAMGLDCSAIGISSIAMGQGTSAIGISSIAMGDTSTATGDRSIALGVDNTATANYAVAMGNTCSASGINSTAMGGSTQAIGSCSTAMGNSTTASGSSSTAMGHDTNAIGGDSTAMGQGTTAHGLSSTAMGQGTTAHGDNSTAMGFDTQAIGNNSTAMGNGTTASGPSSTAMGKGTNAMGTYSTAMGWNTTACGQYSTAMGVSTIASGDYSTAMGFDCSAGGIASFADGSGCSAGKDGDIAMGWASVAGDGPYAQLQGGAWDGSGGNVAIGFNNNANSGTLGRDNGSVAIGGWCKSTGINSTAMGWNTTACGEYSTAMGVSTIASAFASTAMGQGTTGSGEYSTAMGQGTQAIGSCSTAMGNSTTASGPCSIAMGFDCSAGGIASFADGSGCIAGKDGDIAMGWASTAGVVKLAEPAGAGAADGGNVAIGFNNNANSVSQGRDNGSVAIGGLCQSTGINSTAMGWSTTASGHFSTAMGRSTIARGAYSTAMGQSTTASGSFSTAMGFDCSAGGIASFADGSGCTARDDYNVAFGKGANAGGTCGFMYKDACGNTFCFDSGGHDASGQLLVNGSAVRGGGGGSSSGVVGEIIAFAGPSGNSLEDWLFCDGRALSSSDGFGTYLSLYNAISTTYGNGGGHDGDFNIPDLRGRTVYGDASGAPHAANRSSVANSGNISDLSGVVGTDTMSITQMPSHTHGVNDGGHTHTITDLSHNHPAFVEESFGQMLAKPPGGGCYNSCNGPVHSSPPYPPSHSRWQGPPDTDNALTGIYTTEQNTSLSITIVKNGGDGAFLPPAVLVNFFIRYRKESVEGSGVTPGIDVLHGTDEYNSSGNLPWPHGLTMPADTPVRVTLVGGGGAGGNCPGWNGITDGNGDPGPPYTYLGGPGGGGGAGSSYIYWTTAGKAGTATYVTGQGGLRGNPDREATGTSSKDEGVEHGRISGRGGTGGSGVNFSPGNVTVPVPDAPTFSRSMLFGMAGHGGKGGSCPVQQGLPAEGDLAVPGANGMTPGGFAGEALDAGVDGGAGGHSMASTPLSSGSSASSIPWGSGGAGADVVVPPAGTAGLHYGDQGWAGAVIFEWFGGTHAGGGGIIAKGGGHGSSLRTKANNTAQGDYSTAMGTDCSAGGIASFTDGSGCTAHDDYNVALGNGADASGTCGFMFKDICGNTFCFDSGGGGGSGNIKINDKVVAGGSSGPGIYVINTPTGLGSETPVPAAIPRNKILKITLIGGGGGGGAGGHPNYVYAVPNGPAAVPGPQYPYMQAHNGGGGGGGAAVIFYTKLDTMATYSVGAGGPFGSPSVYNDNAADTQSYHGTLQAPPGSTPTTPGQTAAGAATYSEGQPTTMPSLGATAPGGSGGQTVTGGGDAGNGTSTLAVRVGVGGAGGEGGNGPTANGSVISPGCRGGTASIPVIPNPPPTSSDPVPLWGHILIGINASNDGGGGQGGAAGAPGGGRGGNGGWSNSGFNNGLPQKGSDGAIIFEWFS